MASAAVAKGTGMKKGQGEAHATLTSAQGLIALLDEDDDRLRAHALKQLDRVVPDLWFEVSSSIATIEALYEDESFTERSLAALLASKVRLSSAEASSGGRVGPRARGDLRSAGSPPLPVWCVFFC